MRRRRGPRRATVEQRAARAQPVEGEADRGLARAGASALPASASGSPSMRASGTHTPLSSTLASDAGRVEAGVRLKVSSAAGTTNSPSVPESRRAATTTSSRSGAPSTCCLWPRSSQPSPSRSAVATTVQRVPAAALVQRQRAGRAARGHAGQEPVGLGRGARLAHDRGRTGSSRQEGPGRGGPAHLLQHDRQLDEAAAEAAQVDVDRERRPAEPGQRGRRGRRRRGRRRRRRAPARGGHSRASAARALSRSSSCSSVNSRCMPYLFRTGRPRRDVGATGVGRSTPNDTSPDGRTA